MSEERNIQYFSSQDDGTMVKIIVCAVVFHLLVAGICIAFHFVNFKHEPEPIPVFEMVQVNQPVQPRPKPKVDQQLPPEPKVEEKPPEPEPVEEPQPEPEPEPEPQDDFEVDDLDLPTAVEAPSLNPVGSVDMDPLMQVYLERLKQIIMSNFNPPSNLNVRRDVKTTVQFTVDRFGGITAITLKRSSGNKTWDHLSVRAVQISKVPELPPNFRAPSLVLHFNFTPN